MTILINMGPRNLIALVLLSLCLVSFTVACRKAKLIVDTPTGFVLSVLEEDMLTKVNEYRRSKGLPPLRVFEAAADEARRHSEDLAEGRIGFGHVGFEERVKRLGQLVRILSAAENEGFVKGSSQPVDVVFNGWVESSGHRENIEGDYNLTGIGAAMDGQGGIYFTQIFLRTAGGY